MIISTSTRYRFIIQTIIVLITGLVSCQSKSSDPKMDAVMKLAIHYLNTGKSDSLYQLMGEKSRKRISRSLFIDYSDHKLSKLRPFTNLTIIGHNDSVSIYKVYAKIPLRWYVSLDKNHKFDQFFFRPSEERIVKAQALTDNKLHTRLDSVINKVVSDYIQIQGNVGISTGIYYNGKSYFYNYGERKKGNKNLPDAHTIYEIGSITKTFTSTLLAIAVNQKKITPETPVTRFLPDSVAENGYLKNITFKELANHTSGLPRDPDNLTYKMTDLNQPVSDYQTKDMFSFLRHFKQTRTPGTKFEYSNLGAALLGVLLENIYHQSYQELIGQYIIKPLGMNETMCSVDTSKFHNTAQGYDGLLYAVPFLNFVSYQSAGTIKSSASDLINYAKAQLFTADTTLNKAVQLTHQITFNDKFNTFGLGWYYLQGYPDIIQHSGGTVGYSSNISINLHKKIIVVVLTNNVTNGDAVGANLIKAIQAIKIE
ncbi:MAG: serine hydrolase domain-containing protein [Bacteroidota bacterium]